MPTRALPATIISVSSLSEKTCRDDAKVLGVLERPKQAAALLGLAEIEDDGRNVADVGVDRVAEHEQFQHRDEQREEQRRRVAEDVQEFLAGHGDHPLPGEARDS